MKILSIIFSRCVGGLFLCLLQSENGLGLKAVRGGDYCQTTINFPSDTIPKWVHFLVHLVNRLFCYENHLFLSYLYGSANLLIMTTTQEVYFPP